MPTIIPSVRTPIDVEVPAGVPRTKAGSIRLVPGVATTVTARELDCIRKAGIQVRILATPISKHDPITVPDPVAEAPEEAPKEDRRGIKRKRR